MPTTAERILDRLQASGEPMDDDEIAAALGLRRQAVNQACRALEVQGRIRRRVLVGSKIQNILVAAGENPPTVLLNRPSRDGLLSEDEVKEAVRAHLADQGYTVTIAWGHQRGIDIEAQDSVSRLVIEAKGEASLQPQQVNYFLGALGELVQRMSDPDARYGLALPDNRQYQGLVERLPGLAWERLRLLIFMVSRCGDGYVVRELSSPKR